MPRQPSDLDSIRDRLTKLAARRGGMYRIPSLWNSWGFRDFDPGRRGEIIVNPYRLLLDCLDRAILPARGERRLAGRSLSGSQGVRRLLGGKVFDGGTRRLGGDWILAATIYAMLVRTTSAWDHNGDGMLAPEAGARRDSRTSEAADSHSSEAGCEKGFSHQGFSRQGFSRRGFSHQRGRTSERGWTETGTFLKSILLLPLLARMGVDAIYLLPVTKCSQAFRKGEIGSPYSAKNFFEIDPDLHDHLLDDHPATGSPSVADVEMEFGAFVEAAHALGIRVMVDLAPRTASRDNDLILDHPDWFYWIDAAAADDYGPPFVDGYETGIPKPSELAAILHTDVLRKHIARFRPAPSVTHPRRWRRFVAACRVKPPRDLSIAITDEFGVITPPGFSDCLNDPQPPWTDVTFLRLFLDHPAASVKHLDEPARQPPYVFTDTIKASRFPGRRPNRPLWRLLAAILPFYQRFGVDGARVDMGHALSPELQRMIMREPKRHDPDFAFLAEELDHAGGPAAKRAGYNAFIGSSWHMEPRCREGQLHEFVNEILPKAVLPALAAAETPDTPRAVTRNGGRRFARMIAVLNYFLPSAIPFINSGLELFERQPMNHGLDVQRPVRPALPRGDPYYDKLAYFDRVALHWCNAGAKDMIGLLVQAATIRRRFIADLIEPGNFFIPSVAGNRIIAVGWRVERGRRLLIVAANADFRRRQSCLLTVPSGGCLPRLCESLLCVYPDAPPPMFTQRGLRFTLPPSDAKALLVWLRDRTFRANRAMRPIAERSVAPASLKCPRGSIK